MAKMITCPNDVTEEWLKDTLQISFKEDVKVIAFEKITAKNGYLSGAFKAQIKVKNETQKVFIKSILDKEDPFRYMMDTHAMDRIEILFYNTFLPDMIKFEKEKCDGKSELETLVPKVLAADYCLEKEKRGFYLAMEDVSDQFQMIHTEEGISFDQASKCFEKLARFHAIGHAFVKNQSEAIEGWKLDPLYEKFKTDPFWTDFLKNYESTVEAISKLKPELKEPLETIGKKWWEIYDHAFFLKEKDFLVHGDFWLNNVLFSKDNCRILDWQCFCLGHPAMDIGYMLGTSMAPANLNKWMEDLLAKYWSKFESTCKQMNVSVPYTEEKFKQRVNTDGLMGIAGFFILSWNDFATKNGMEPRGLEVIKLAIDANKQYF